ncbi:MAG: DUF4062 domain-containing protein [Fimbriimonas sp.]|nr:DUF4062 domain-containing protein [Fimbriimonas sp.]
MMKMNEPKLKMLVSSAVYGIEELLDQVFGLLDSYGYEVWMSHKGTVPLASSGTAFDNCLEAVEKCDLFLSIITTRYGSGKIGDELSITHRELKRAIELDKPRWVLAHDHVPFARSVLQDYGLGSASAREALRRGATKRSTVLDDLRIIDMYEAALRIDVKELDERTGNWVQKYREDDDVLLFACAQFSRYDEVKTFLEEKLGSPSAVKQRIGEVKGNG